MARKKSEAVESVKYWLVSFENDFLREFERLGKKEFSFEKYKEWNKAVTLYVRMYYGLYGFEPHYNSEFMQAVAVADVCRYTFAYGWPEREKVAS